MSYIDTLDKYKSVPGLDSELRLLNKLGNPQNATGIVHIAGTNGKGSVGTYICSVLREAGYKVGRFCSPAVENPLEIFQLNNVIIEEDEYNKLSHRIQIACESITEEGYSHPTKFECETALAFLYFEHNHCDIAVVECGMGGSLDATNVIEEPIVDVITTIDMDHMQFLGDTIEQIAKHKAGIIKKSAITVAFYDSRTASILSDKTDNLVFTMPEDIMVCGVENNSFIINYRERHKIEIGLEGKYQTINAAIALDVIDALISKGYTIPESTIRQGIANARLFGRFMYLSMNPDFIIDGAHNPHAAKALRSNLEYLYPNKKFTLIIGVFSDKDYMGILDILIPISKKVITMETPDNIRALPAKKLAEYIKKYYDISVESACSIKDSIKIAYLDASSDDVIIACGSLSHLKLLETEFYG